MSMQINYMCSKCPPPERMHASERLLRTRPMFSETVVVSVGVSKLRCTQLSFCRAGGENKRCLLPRRAAWWRRSYCQSLGRYQGMSSCFSRTVLQHTVLVRHWALTSRDAPDFISPEQWPPNSPDLNPVDYKIWATMQQCIQQTKVEMLTNCDSVCWTFGAALNN